MISSMSRFLRTRSASEVSSPSLAFILTRPTDDKSYRSESKNSAENRASAVSSVGGSPGRITL